MSAGEYNQPRRTFWTPRPGMRRMFEECRATWGDPNAVRVGHDYARMNSERRRGFVGRWPVAVLEQVCELKLYVGSPLA